MGVGVAVPCTVRLLSTVVPVYKSKVIGVVVIQGASALPDTAPPANPCPVDLILTTTPAGAGFFTSQVILEVHFVCHEAI